MSIADVLKKHGVELTDSELENLPEEPPSGVRFGSIRY